MFGWEKEIDDLKATPPARAPSLAHVHAATTPRRQAATVPVRPGMQGRPALPPRPAGPRHTGPVQFLTSAYSPDLLPPPEPGSSYQQAPVHEARSAGIQNSADSFRDALALGTLSLVPSFPRPEEGDVPPAAQTVTGSVSVAMDAPQPLAGQPLPVPTRRDNVRPLALVPSDHMVRESVPADRAPSLADIFRQAAVHAGALQALLSQAAEMLVPIPAEPPPPDITIEPESDDAASVPPTAPVPTP